MRIAYLANLRFPSERAHSVQIAHMCEAFAQQNNEVELIVNGRVSATKTEIDAYVGCPTSFITTRLSCGYFNPKVLLTYYFSELFFSFWFLFRRKVSSYDLIFSRSEWIVWLLSLFVTKEKLMWESHEAKLNYPARSILRKGIRTVVISQGVFEHYRSWGADGMLLVAHDGIDESFFEVLETREQARQRLGLPANEHIAMYIGGFDRWKGVETFFAAADLCPNVLFVAIGGRKEDVASYRELYPKVTFVGSRPYKELRHNQQAADVLIIPNTAQNALSERFTSPLKLFAHMASGKPLLASKVPSLECVLKGNAHYFKPDDPQSLANALYKVFADYQISKQQASLLLSQSQEYTWKKRAEAILRFFVD